MSVSPERLASRGWLRFGGAILLMVAAVAACAPAPGGTTAATVSISPIPGSAAPTASTTPADILSRALDPLLAAAAFETRVEVDGTEVVSATGRSVGNTSTTSVTTSGRTVDYVQIPPQTWAREPGAAWVLVSSDPASTAPLAVLSKPLTLAIAQGGGSGTSLDATYPAAALGLTGDPVAVTITIDGTGLTFRYQATTSGHTTSSTTTLRPSPADPIVAPSP